jgi:hypothetical protein
MQLSSLRWLPLFLLLIAGCQEKGTRITAVVPNYGRAAGGEEVFIRGHGFGPGLAVQFGQRAATGLVIESAQELRVSTPPGVEGPVDVIVTLDNGKTIVLKNGFRYDKKPEWDGAKKP